MYLDEYEKLSQEESQKKELVKVHEQAKKEFDVIYTSVRDERIQANEDRRFYSIPGAQWEGDLSKQFANKPRFEVNKVHLSVIRIINEYRNNRITVDFKSKTKDDDIADLCDGMYRACENDSSAEEAYDNAFEESVAGGIGAWRLRARYEESEDIDNDQQVIDIEPIYDADTSVFYDIQSKRQDKADADHCFVLTAFTYDAYRNTWGEDPTSWGKAFNTQVFDWATPDVVYVAEYYKVEVKTITYLIWTNADGQRLAIPEDDMEDYTTKIREGQFKFKLERKIKKQKVRKYFLSGSRVLEDCGYIAGPNIPIIMTFGKRWYVDNIERCMGHVRLAKDAQRLKNMQLSKLGELAALSPVEKPIFTPKQIMGHQTMWENANVNDYPYLLINPIVDDNGNEINQGPIATTKPPSIPQALAVLLQLTEEDMNDLLGNQQDGEQITGNVSTDTVMFVQNRIDMQTFIYMSNMSKAVRRSGEVWLGMAKEVYVEPNREVKLIGSQDDVSTVKLKVHAYNPIKGFATTSNDLSTAKAEVVVAVGPSSSTKRNATVRALVGVLGVTEDPEIKQVLTSLILTNMEGEGISDVRDFFRQRLLRAGVLKPNDDEKTQLEAEMAAAKEAPEDPQSIYLRSEAKAADARALESKLKAVLTAAKASKTKAETADILAGMDAKERKEVIEILDRVLADARENESKATEMTPGVLDNGNHQPSEQ